MITTITLNPAIDRTLIVDQCILGKVHRIKSCREDVGGKGINVAKVIHLLEGETTAIGFLGSRNKKEIEAYFHQENIQFDFVDIDDKNRVNTKIVDLSTMTTTDFNDSGFQIHAEQISLIKSKVEEYAKVSDYMIFSGSMPWGCSEGLYKELIELVKDHTKTVLDADGKLLAEGIKASPFLIKPNIHELENTFGVKVDSIEDVIHAAQKISKNYDIRWVLVSMGKEGSVLVSKEKVIMANPIPVKAINSVGAGDSMLGGFINSYALDEDPFKALVYGTACGTLAVTTEGTQGFTKDQVQVIQSKVVVNDVSSQYDHH
ncbi:1-phosphofructokinase [Vallitalea okinawensis]|uniref:1-phosphofructokinase n=1 Tax=Vallitalea okinawensis TaxID=2078660 RepID=UPI000CFC72B9|nr:1-phosphofructokinase [Vallitalea okinawensis]